MTVNPWLRAIQLVASAPEAGEALRSLLEEVIAASGAAAGAILDGEAVVCRAARGFGAGELESLLAPDGMAAVAHARREEWPHAPFWLSEPTGSAQPGTPPGRLLIAPLRLRGVSLGSLLLAFAGETTLVAEQIQSVEALAGVAALTLENDHLFEEMRRAQQARDHFLTAIHHELRTPATAVMLNAGLLSLSLAGDMPPRLETTVRALEADLTELIRVIETVLDLGKLEAGFAPARDDLIDPRGFVLDLLRRIEPSANRKGLTLSVFVPRALPVIQADRERVSRILLHLLGNAIKYTEEGRIEVRIGRSMGRNRRESLLTIRVSDTGRGIPPEELGRVFEPFAQVEEGARTDSQARGVGLGLPLARKLARSLGGEVSVESRVGRGTVATLQLPYRQSVSG